MPVAVKLSKTFYDRFGHEAADELVGVLNQVDAASQNSLREMNEQNFARFDAKLGQRLAELKTELLPLIERKASAESVAELKAQVAKLATKDQLIVLMCWMIGMWVTVFLAVIGLWFRR